MVAGAQSVGWAGPSRRRVPRFHMKAAVDVTVLRSGIPDKVPGRALNLCERGVAAVLAGELNPGESVGVELQLTGASEPLRTRATVRYQDKLRCGLEFVTMSAEQRTTIREWAKEAAADAELGERPASLLENENSSSNRDRKVDSLRHGKGNGPGKRNKRISARYWLTVCVLISMAAGAFWWKWNKSWEEMESGLRMSENGTRQKAQAQVPAEVMQKLLVHRVEPVYPVEARKQKLQGIIALNILVGKDGSVVSMRALNGPEILSRAAMDALRWWKFEPYRLNGEPATVETTVAVEFKR